MQNKTGNELIKIERVGVRYGPVVVLRDINMTVRQGERIAIVGRSGCGKSTLLNILASLDTCYTGTIDYLNELKSRSEKLNWLYFILGLGRKERIREWALATVRRKMGFVFQTPFMLENFDVLYNVSLGRSNVQEKEAEKLIKKDLSLGQSDHMSYELSGGQRQRVVIGRTLATKSVITFADEPTGSLDSNTATVVMELLCPIESKGKDTVVLVTHHSQHAVDYCNRTIGIRDFYSDNQGGGHHTNKAFDTHETVDGHARKVPIGVDQADIDAFIETDITPKQFKKEP